MSLADELKVVEMLEKGLSQASIVLSLGISKSQVSRIKKASLELRKIQQEKSVTLKSKKSISKSKYPEVDKSVYKWFCNVQHLYGKCKPLPLSRAIIQARARHVAESLNLVDFKASNGWIRGWLWRNEMGRSVRLHGEATDLDLKEAETAMLTLRRQPQNAGYQLKDIFNMDETGILYRCLPNQSYVLEVGDTRQLCRGTKAMKAKDRVTFVMCVNATGTCKVPVLIIGSAKQPHCFRDAPCPIPYIDQPKAWVDKVRYRHWWHRIFLPCIRGFTKDKVALLMDSCPGHDKEFNDPTGQVKVANKLKPLDQGIIAAFKTKYKSKILARLVSTLDNYDELQNQAKKVGKGRTGLAFGCAAHVRDAAEIIKECWEEVSQDTIIGCWTR